MAFSLPYSFVAKTTAKAAQVMANLNRLKEHIEVIEGLETKTATFAGPTTIPAAAGATVLSNTVFTLEVPCGAVFNFASTIANNGALLTLGLFVDGVQVRTCGMGTVAEENTIGSTYGVALAEGEHAFRVDCSNSEGGSTSASVLQTTVTMIAIPEF